MTEKARTSITEPHNRISGVGHGSRRARLVELRDAVRRLAAEHTHDPRSLGQSPASDQWAAMSIVNRASAMSSVRLSWWRMDQRQRAATRRDQKGC
jgi:hypothetical protein